MLRNKKIVFTGFRSDFSRKLPLVNPEAEECACDRTNAKTRCNRTGDTGGRVSKNNPGQPNHKKYDDQKVVDVLLTCAKTVPAVHEVIIGVKSKPNWKKCREQDSTTD